jgi:general secretion pathway protein E
MSQRLVRTLCSHCKQAEPTDQIAWQALVGRFSINAPEALFRPVGCKHCRDTGYLGRQGIYEVLVADAPLHGLIVEQHAAGPLREAAIKGGMVPLRLAGAEKIVRGETTIEEVLRVAPAEDY